MVPEEAGREAGGEGAIVFEVKIGSNVFVLAALVSELSCAEGGI